MSNDQDFSQPNMSAPRLGKGLLIVVSAPSGAGKTSLCHELSKNMPNLRHSVSYTTRQPRNAEADGRDYWFVSPETFEKMVADGEFAEWAKVHGNFYGTAKKTLDEMRERGTNVILDIDTQGAGQIRKSYPDGVFIFILPPSIEVLEARLRNRKSDREDEITRRMARAMEEIAAYGEYDYIVVNDDFKAALRELQAIVAAEKCRVSTMDTRWVKNTLLGG